MVFGNKLHITSNGWYFYEKCTFFLFNIQFIHTFTSFDHWLCGGFYSFCIAFSRKKAFAIFIEPKLNWSKNRKVLMISVAFEIIFSFTFIIKSLKKLIFFLNFFWKKTFLHLHFWLYFVHSIEYFDEFSIKNRKIGESNKNVVNLKLSSSSCSSFLSTIFLTNNSITIVLKFSGCECNFIYVADNKENFSDIMRKCWLQKFRIRVVVA